MNKNKLLWIGILIIFVIVVIMVVLKVKPKNNDGANNTTISQRGNGSETNKNTNANENNAVTGENKYIKKELSDGVLYSITGDKIEPDLVIGTNYFVTTINDILLNFNDYKGKTVEIEGMYLTNLPYMFVGRRAENILCADCPPGYSYFEFELIDNEDLKLKEEDDWIKVIGTLEAGNDSNTDYYYIKVQSIEIMKERGQETVTN